MIEVQFVDGTSGSFEGTETGENQFIYDSDSQLFKIQASGRAYVVIPREFVKFIRYVEV
jgi:hypothetical protein